MTESIVWLLSLAFMVVAFIRYFVTALRYQYEDAGRLGNGYAPLRKKLWRMGVSIVFCMFTVIVMMGLRLFEWRSEFVPYAGMILSLSFNAMVQYIILLYRVKE